MPKDIVLIDTFILKHTNKENILSKTYTHLYNPKKLYKFLAKIVTCPTCNHWFLQRNQKIVFCIILKKSYFFIFAWQFIRSSFVMSFVVSCFDGFSVYFTGYLVIKYECECECVDITWGIINLQSNKRNCLIKRKYKLKFV